MYNDEIRFRFRFSWISSRQLHSSTRLVCSFPISLPVRFFFSCLFWELSNIWARNNSFSHIYSYLLYLFVDFIHYLSIVLDLFFFLFSEIRGESVKQGVIRLFRQHPGHFCLPYFHSWCATHKHIFIWHRSWCIFPFPGAVPEGITPFVMYDGVLVDIPPASLFFWDTPLLPPFSCFPPLAL